VRFQSQAGVLGHSVQQLEDRGRLGKLVAGHVERPPEAELEKWRQPTSLDVDWHLARQIELRNPFDIRRNACLHTPPRLCQGGRGAVV
jgi:hypothetical protein